MMARHFLGVAKDHTGRIAPVFAEADLTLDALAHHRAVVDALRHGPFLPAVFGSTLADDPRRLAKRLKACQGRLQAELDRSIDAVEIGVRFTLTTLAADAPRSSVSGRDFLRSASSRSTTISASIEKAKNIIRLAGSEAGVLQYRILSETASGLQAAFAVRRDAAAKIAALLQDSASTVVAVDVSGPWPLYSFGLRDLLSPGEAA
jgi:hypothetical protein